MSEIELKDWLKSHLSLDIEEWDATLIHIKLKIDDETFTSVSISLPTP
jgi:hypothetical protein